jgi:hypothetical protein
MALFRLADQHALRPVCGRIDQFPPPASEGFSKGIVWRGLVNASQMPQMQAAQNVSQVFMGVNLKCASCHDSFINDWQLSDAYGLANVFSDHPLEIYRCDQPTGQQAPTKFIFRNWAICRPPPTNRSACARWPPHHLPQGRTPPAHDRQPPVGQISGRGLVEPVDDMQQTAWDPDLLDWLAQDLVAHGYDLKETMERILTSRAYQLPAVDLGERQNTNYVFTGPDVRRMTAEQFRDALTSLTGAGYAGAGRAGGHGRKRQKKFGPKLKAKWIWNDPGAATNAKPAAFTCANRSTSAVARAGDAMVFATTAFELFVNGHKAGSGRRLCQAFMVDLKPWLKPGDNLIAVRRSTPLRHAQSRRLVVYARVRARPRTARNSVMDFVSDKSWLATEKQTAGWEQPGFVAQDWTPASELGGAGMAPWRLPGDTIARQFAGRSEGGVRAALVRGGPVDGGLGRPNREQVVTTRPTRPRLCRPSN